MSQLICLYRRNHHLDRKRCFYSKYLCLKNQQLHKALIFVNNENKQSISNYFEESTHDETPSTFESLKTYFAKNYQFTNDQLEKLQNFTSKFIFEKRFDLFYKNLLDDAKSDSSEETKLRSKKQIQEKTQKQNEKYDKFFSVFTKMLDELEFQLGVECIQQGDFRGAVDHFRMSLNSNNASAYYNLALIYENGLGGIQKNLNIAKHFYEMASERGHKKALYNLGVFFAQGIGGTKKSFKDAKMCFEKAASLGDPMAEKALTVLPKISSQGKGFMNYNNTDVTNKVILAC